MAKIKAHYKVQLNSNESIEELLQELYDEADNNIVEIQREMNKLASSSQLSEEAMDAKAKYAKAMNDFIVNKNKAITTKLDIAKLMSEILKYNGKTNNGANLNEVLDWGSLTENIVLDDISNDDKPTPNETNDTEEYITK